jgi:hypothetical protein
MRNLFFGLSFVLAAGAAVLFRYGWEELAASVWFVSLALLTPYLHKQV